MFYVADEQKEEFHSQRAYEINFHPREKSLRQSRFVLLIHLEWTSPITHTRVNTKEKQVIFNLRISIKFNKDEE